MALQSQFGSRAAPTAFEAGDSVPRPGVLARRALRALAVPSLRSAPLAARTAGALASMAAATMSWERFGNLAVGPYNVKLPVILFALALVLAAPTSVRRAIELARTRSLPGAIVLLAAVIVACFVVRAFFVDPRAAGLGQIASVLTGAAGPGLVAIGLVRTRQDLRWFLVWVVRGAVIAGVFGLWQLFAFYTGLPQGVVYTGVGTSGVGGRIAAFSYEPAYFAYYLIVAAGAALAVARLDRRPLPWRVVVFFGIVLALANVRALMFLLPVVALLLAVDWRRNRTVLVRAAVAAVPIALAATFGPVVLQSAAGAVQQVVSSAQQPSSATAPDAGRREGQLGAERGEPTSEPTPPPTPTPASEVPDPVIAPPSAVLDPAEQSSNSPRLAGYRATLDVDLQNLLIGVGPGGLRRALGAGEGVQTQGGLVVANNVWLQAAADGGVLLLLLEVAAALGMTVCWWRARSTSVQPLAATWIGVLAVGGMLTSTFFDLKLWVLGAIVLAGLTIESARGADDRPRADVAPPAPRIGP